MRKPASARRAAIRRGVIGMAAVLGSLSLLGVARAESPWLDPHRSPDARAALAVAAMTLDEKIGLLHGPMALTWVSRDGTAPKIPPEAIPAAGYVPGIPRLGIPALFETDASLGVANPNGVRPDDVATAMPAGLLLASTFDPALAYQAGALVGAEAHAKGFNVLLGGGMNLTRDPRNGRNFEYLGEDPWLAAVLDGEAIRGTQDQYVISTIKHFALNANETNRQYLDARIDRTALRESDLLAFEIAIERGRPGSVMCAYNKVNADYSCANHWLLSDVLKGDWHYPGWVMSDWGAVHGVEDASQGLDQQSGEQLDKAVFFDAPLKAAVANGSIPAARIDDMVKRILRSMFAVGIIEHPPVKSDIDYAAHRAVALDVARKGIVLLKNDASLLPLVRTYKKIAVIGGYANSGVLSGGGSAQVMPSNTPFLRVPTGGIAPNWIDPIFDPPSPLEAVQKAAPNSSVSYDSGAYPAGAAALAASADIVIVFAVRHEMEGFDAPGLDLPDGQDAMIAAVAAANPHTIVVLETGNPVTMPWLAQVPAVLAAWYPGQEGAEAIADILFGVVNPSGRLPISFPRSSADLVRPALPNLGAEPRVPVHIDYTEGSDVGYRGYAARGVTPLFPFGFGLSYTHFDYRNLTVSGGRTLSVKFEVHNSGTVKGADVPQVYLTSAAGKRVVRLIGFQRVELNPGERRMIALTADSRVLGYFDAERGQWRVKRGAYQLKVGRSAADGVLGGEAALNGI
jgi:beta-glucosidase